MIFFNKVWLKVRYVAQMLVNNRLMLGLANVKYLSNSVTEPPKTLKIAQAFGSKYVLFVLKQNLRQNSNVFGFPPCPKIEMLHLNCTDSYISICTYVR